MNFEVNPDDTFEQFNFLDTNDEIFDNYFNNKRELGKILRETTKLIGVESVSNILNAKLDSAIVEA